ncbi:MAG: SDR family NAD(P)-dependent oxidoreductase [Myxococcales bacterium]|nr:SDR family NAD(P)-dependent oxidoreductase [Myxococcales bacterium]
MKPTVLVCGHGPGISDAVARRFGREGHPVAIVARSAERLTAAAAALTEAGVTARAFPCDLGDVAAVARLIGEVSGALGPIGVIHWNAYRGGAGDLLAAEADELRGVLDVSVHGLIAAVRAARAELVATHGAVLVTGGGFAFYDPAVDAMATQYGAMGLAIGKAAQHKAVGLLHAQLAGDGVFVGEVVVTGMVKGTAFDHGNATLEPAAIADRLWDLAAARTDATVTFG